MARNPTRKKLAELIEAYDNGDADDDLNEFLDTWTAILTPGKVAEPEPEVELEVLVHGHPFDTGLSVEGPYPRGFLENCEITRHGGWWIVPVDDLTFEVSEGWVP
jgi:hypothetical protein